MKGFLKRVGPLSAETSFTRSRECSEKEKDALWTKYLFCRRAGYIKPFHTRRQPPKTCVYQLGAHVVKEYSGCRQQVDRELEILHHIATPGHPSLVTYSFIADQGPRVSVVMEWAGECLRDIGSLALPSDDNEGTARYIMHQLTSALGYLHAKGVIHRDIKPDNIGITVDQCVRLFDWGEALTLTEAHCVPERSLAKLVGVAGTPVFMAPEVLQHLTGRPGPNGRLYSLRDTLTTKLDTWGLGCVLFFLLAGRDIFVADECWELEGLADVAGASGGVELPEGVVASAAARDFLSRCLVRDPALRASARELAQHPWLAGAESEEELAAARGALAAVAVADVLGPTEVCMCGRRGGGGGTRLTALVRVVADDGDDDGDTDDGCSGSSSSGGSGGRALHGGCGGGSLRRRLPPPHCCCVAPDCELRSPRISVASGGGSDEATCRVMLQPPRSTALLAALATAPAPMSFV